MKNFKKLFAVLAAIMMAFSLTATAVSADAKEWEISSDDENHTLEVYQVFTGTAKDGKLTNLKYGENAVGETGKAVTEEDMGKLSDIEGKTYADDQAKIADLKEFVDFESTPVAEVTKGNPAKLPEGYYVIKDKDKTLDGSDKAGYTLFIFTALTEDLPLSLKADVPSSEKKVDDVNDSTGEEDKLQDSADYEIGDKVPYTLTATLPSNYADYKSYTINFIDNMSKGLTFDGNARIYFGASDEEGTAIKFTSAASEKYDGGTKWVYEIEDLKTTAPELKADDVITIKYEAVLNQDAVIGALGNPNEYHIEFSNNPNQGKDGPKGQTPEDINIVFTFKTIFNKVDGEGNPLEGADFKLEKLVNGEWVDVTTLGGNNGAHPTMTKDGNKFEFCGLDDGDYKLTETVTPKGYNEIDPIKFTITAEHDVLSDNPALTSLTGTDGEEFTMTPDVSAGSLEANVINESGAKLPETGGMGTVLIYTVGGILVAAAGLMLITKKRMGAE